jgi:molybdopterin synthase catalytic subunit
MVRIVDCRIDESQLYHAVHSDLAGARILFAGTTRGATGDKVTKTLCYEAYHEMAVKSLEKLRSDAMQKWPLQNVAIVHRVGEVPVGECSVAVAVSSPHRAEAFAAVSWIMDRLKDQVPIWKKEFWADGSSQWVHPGNGVESQVEDSR